MPLYEGIGLINEKHPVVLEIGQSYTKAGFAGETSPRCIIPSVVRIKGSLGKYRQLGDFKNENDLYQLLVEFLNFLYCKHLLVTPKDRKVVIVESIFTKTIWRKVLAKVLFCHYEVLNVLWVPAHLAAVNATGSDSALVLDIGRDEAIIIPVFYGVTLLKDIKAMELGSKVFDRNLKQLAMGHCLNTPTEILDDLLDDRAVEDLRVRACFVTNSERAAALRENSENFSKNVKPFRYEVEGKNFLLFDGVLREKAAEIWFPSDDPEGESLPLMILETLSKVPIDARKLLASSILIVGGTAMLPGLKCRLIGELNNVIQGLNESHNLKLGRGYEFKLFKSPFAENCAAWGGGSIYGASEAMNLRAVSKEFFLKSGVVPDWCDPNCNLVNGLSSSGITPMSANTSLSKSL